MNQQLDESLATLDDCSDTFFCIPLLQALLARAVFQTISVGLTDTREKVVSMALALLDQVVSTFSSSFVCSFVIHVAIGHIRI